MWIHRLGIILCVTTGNFKQNLLQRKPRGKHSNCLTEQFQQFLDSLLLFAAAATLRGRLLAVFPAVVDSSPSSFSIIPGQAVDATGTAEEGEHSALARTRGMSMSMLMSLLVDLLIASTVFVFTPSGSVCCDLLQI